MKAEKYRKSEKKTTTSPRKGRKTRETERNPRRKKEGTSLSERLKSETDSDKRKTRRDFFAGQTENKSRPSGKRNVDEREKKPARPRRDDDRRTPSPRRDDDRRTPSFRRDDDRRTPSFRRDDDRRTPSPRHRFGESDDFPNRSSSRPRSGKSRFEENDDFLSRPRRSKNRFEEEPQESKPRRRRTGMESEIVRTIVHKRRETGRGSERKPKILSLSWNEDRGLIRLNKYIANSGICSRREADDLIIAGAVTVNGKIVTELGVKVMPTDEVRYEDKILQREKPIYILLNKPKDYITTTEDDRGRDNVMMLIEGACQQRVYPVGRLDRNTTGLLLFTNDGEMTKKLTHPRFGFKKIYQVELDKDLKLEDFETIKNGIELEDGLMQPDELEYVEGKKIVGITLHSGKNRIVRRLFGHLGYEVEKLDRVYYAGLTKKNLSRGQWRILRQDEINILKMSL